MTSENVTPGNEGLPPSVGKRMSPTRPVGRNGQHCPECGAAVIDYNATRCWLCERPLTPGSAVEISEDEEQEPPRRERRRISIVMVLLGILMLLWGVGVAIEVPGVLVVILIVLTPVLVRTARSVSIQQARGEEPSGAAIVGQFLSSVGVVAMVGLAVIATFYVTCFAVCLAGAAVGADRRSNFGSLLFLSVTGGAVMAIFVLVALIRRIRRRSGPEA